MSPAIDAPLLHLLDEPALREVPDGVGPYPGEVVSWGARPATRVSTDEKAVAPLWDAGGEHVAEAREILRTVDGHAVVVPLCTQSVCALAAGRADRDHVLSPGEVVTLAVSVLRGTLAEHTAHGGGLCRGEWWLDDDGTPLFVHVETGEDSHAAAITAMEAVRDACAGDDQIGRVLGDAIRALADAPRLPTRIRELESDLFALAPPEAIGTLLLARRTRAEGAAPERPPAADRPAWERWAVAADAGVAEMASQALTDVRRALRARRERARTPSRRGALLAAMACAALVIAAGLLWPTDDARPEPTSVSGSPEPSTVDVGEIPGNTSTEDPIVAVRQALDDLRGCGDDATCQRGLFDEDAALIRDGATVATDGAAFADDASRRLTLLDDIGGLVLMRADDATGSRRSQVVALLRQDEKWVLRDIHDVAQHPG